MKVKQIKFIGGSGINNTGIKVWTDEAVQKDGVTVIDNVERTRQVPISFNLRKKVSTIKPIFLMLTGHWMPEWNDLMTDGDIDREKVNEKGYTGLVSLLDKTVINNVKAIGDSVVLSGSIRVLGNKVVNITTPVISEADEFEMYEDLLSSCQDIAAEVKAELERTALFSAGEAKQMLLDLFKEQKKDEDYNRVLEQDDKMSEDEMLIKLTEKGYTIYEPIKMLEEVNPLDDDLELTPAEEVAPEKPVKQKKQQAKKEKKEISQEEW